MRGSLLVRRGLPSGVAGLEFADLALGLILADPVGFLKLAGELIALAVDDVELIVRKLAPLLLHLALELLPIAFHLIPIHLRSPSGHTLGYRPLRWLIEQRACQQIKNDNSMG